MENKTDDYEVIPFNTCFECDGTGQTIVGWDNLAYENIEGDCLNCDGSGWVQEY